MNLFERIWRFLFGGPPQREELPAAAAPPGPAPQAAADPYFAGTQEVTAPAGFRVKKSIGLDAKAFLPITREEIKKEARGTNLFRNVWFGRRDLIPPVDDPRTMLIDRAMASQGFL